ncbi:PhnE/PtxC family ABC transporter permease [Nesterenkonia flava]|uniref:ABC transporter permease subunit n=2 Tax=Nesterenkonia flava TaxID=469799 RepID=A0ABU1FUJ7_9MICC|nr:ABC transporter permease subunit [Nesterenkonia flava]MDR5711937.1 ABC transporter permease subunit [Nesterenkonia flava]
MLGLIYFWTTNESDTIVWVPLGGSSYLYAPLWPLVGAVLLVVAVALAWRVRASALSAAGIVGFVLVSWWAGRNIGFDLTPLFGDGLQRAMPIYQQFLSPNWSYLLGVWDVWVITIAMAIVATVLGCLLGLGFALLASPVSSPNKVTSQIVKAINSVVRAIPDVGYAYLFLAFIGGTAFGMGALAGVLTLLLFNIGIMAKLTGETIDAVQRGPLEAADAAGANLIQRNRVAVLPQIMPGFVSYGLYVFELNIRASAALGLVGIAGVGQEIGNEWARLSHGYANLSALMIALVVVVLLVDLLSLTIRRKLL